MDAQQIAKFENLFEKLTTELHIVKGSMAANTSFTKEVLDRIDVIHEKQSRTDAKLATMAESQVEMLEVFNAGKKGVAFFQGLGRFLNRAARWLTPILLAGGALYALWHGQPPKGHE